MASRRTEVALDNKGADREFIELADRTVRLCDELGKSIGIKRLLGKRRKKDIIINELHTLLGDIEAAINNLAYSKRISSFVELRDKINGALEVAA